MNENRNPKTPPFMSELVTVGAFFAGLLIGALVVQAATTREIRAQDMCDNNAQGKYSDVADDLNAQLVRAVNQEDYKEAARLRDLIASKS